MDRDTAKGQTPAPAAPAARFRGFAGALMFASLLAGVGTTALSGMPVRVGALALTTAAWAVGWAVVAGRRPRWFPLVVLLALGAGALWGFQLSKNLQSVPMRNMQVATALSYGAIGLAAGLCILRFVGEAKALLVTFSVAVGLLSMDAIIAPPPAPSQTPWKQSLISDPGVGHRYAPHSIATNYYPDNPRGYFEQTDPHRATWSLETHEGSEAQLEHLEPPGTMRVTIAKLGGPVPWYVKLKQAPFEVRQSRRYVLTFQARSREPRRIAWTVAQNEAPWKLHAPYWEADLQADWKAFQQPFVASATDTNARVFFDLGGSRTATEIANVSLRDVAAGREVAPYTSTEYFIRYRFNALGFRGPDYVVPRPADTVRILSLGDSYTLGVGVHEQDTFSAQLERRLNETAGRTRDAVKHEVINAGVSGYDTRQERLTYELYASAYAPQVVLLVMVYNDDLAYADEVRLGFTRPAGAKPVSNLWSRLQAMRGPERVHDYTKAIRELLALNESCRQRNAKLVVVIFRSTGFTPWRGLVEAVNEGVQGTAIPVLDLHEALLGDGRDERDLWVHPIDGHPNEVAHRLAAAEIERFLRAQGIIR